MKYFDVVFNFPIIIKGLDIFDKNEKPIVFNKDVPYVIYVDGEHFVIVHHNKRIDLTKEFCELLFKSNVVWYLDEKELDKNSLEKLIADLKQEQINHNISHGLSVVESEFHVVVDLRITDFKKGIYISPNESDNIGKLFNGKVICETPKPYDWGEPRGRELI